MIGQDGETFQALLVCGVALLVCGAAFALGYAVRGLKCRDEHRLPVCGAACVPEHGVTRHAYDRRCVAPRRRPVTAEKLLEETKDWTTGEIRDAIRSHRGHADAG